MNDFDINVCPVCYAITFYDDRGRHDEWHMRLAEQTARALGVPGT